MIDSRFLECAGQVEIEENFNRALSLYGLIYNVTYYVDGNAGLDTNNGLTWATAFKTLAVAMAASHANIALNSTGWAARNRIFYKADVTDDDDGENLVLLAQKTDVIGVGSTDWRAKPQLLGNHVIPNTAETHGCRFINMSFIAPAAGGDIFTLTDQHGIAFIGCSFRGNSTTAATAAIIATACVDLQIIKCDFTGAFSDAVIELGAGQADGLLIDGCFIQGANEGIDIPATVTYAANKCGLIQYCLISVALQGIKDALGTTFVKKNEIRTAANKGEAMVGAILCGLSYAFDNRITTGDANNVVYPAQGSI